MAFAAADDEYLVDDQKTSSVGIQTQTEYVDYGDENNDESQMNDQNSFFCFHCMKNHFNYDLFLWSNCNHHFSRECASFEIQRQLYHGQMPQCPQDKSTIPTYLNNNNNNNTSPLSKSPTPNTDENDTETDTETQTQTQTQTTPNKSNPKTTESTNNSNTNNTNTTNNEPQTGPCNQILMNDEASTLLDEDTYEHYVNLFRDWRQSVYLPNKSKMATNLNDDNSPLFVLTEDNSKKNRSNKARFSNFFEIRVTSDKKSNESEDDSSDEEDESENKFDTSFSTYTNNRDKNNSNNNNNKHNKTDSETNRIAEFDSKLGTIVSFEATTNGDGDSSSSEADIAYNNNEMTFGHGIYDVRGNSVQTQTTAAWPTTPQNVKNKNVNLNFDEKSNDNMNNLNLYDDTRIESKKSENKEENESTISGLMTANNFKEKLSSLNSKQNNTNNNNSNYFESARDTENTNLTAWGENFGSRIRSISMGVSLNDRITQFKCQHCGKVFENTSQFDIFEWCPIDINAINSNNDNSNNIDKNKENENNFMRGECGHQIHKQCATDIVVNSLFSQEMPRCPCKKLDGKTTCNHYLMENEAIKLLGMESELFHHYATLAIEKNAMNFDDFNSLAALTAVSLKLNSFNNNKNNNDHLYDDTENNNNNDNNNNDGGSGSGSKSPQKNLNEIKNSNGNDSDIESDKDYNETPKD